MATDYPQLTEHPDHAIRYIEYRALKKLVYSGSKNDLVEAQSERVGHWPHW